VRGYAASLVARSFLRVISAGVNPALPSASPSTKAVAGASLDRVGV
jgi:hypothetical protein